MLRDKQAARLVRRRTALREAAEAHPLGLGQRRSAAGLLDTVFLTVSDGLWFAGRT